MPYQEPAEYLSDRKLPAANESDAPRSLQTLKLPRVKPGDPAGHGVLASLESALLRIQSIEGEALRGEGEGIHRLRTSTRRLRSELRAFRDLVALDWVEEIGGELKWLAGLLGAVRDVDVLSRRLQKALSSQENSDLAAMSPLFDELTARHANGLRAMRNALQGDRYRALLTAMQHAIEHPAFNEEAEVPCRIAIPPLAEAAWRRLKSSARDLRPSDPDEKFHEVRKRAKRARYTSEMVAPILGRSAARDARRFIKKVTEVQDTLGEHQDAIVAAQEIVDSLARHPDDSTLAAAGRRLLEAQHLAAREARSAFFGVWDKLDRKKLWRWMKRSSKARR